MQTRIKMFRDNFYFSFSFKNVHLAYPQSAGRKNKSMLWFRESQVNRSFVDFLWRASH